MRDISPQSPVRLQPQHHTTMQYVKTVFGAIHIHDLMQAHAQLEADFLLKGWLREWPSNLRRMRSTWNEICRMGIKPWTWNWVDIWAGPAKGDDPRDEDVRIIYLANVLQYKLVAWPLKAAAKRLIDPRWLHAVRPDVFDAPVQNPTA